MYSLTVLPNYFSKGVGFLDERTALASLLMKVSIEKGFWCRT